MDLPGHQKVLAPGMEQVIYAGEEYTIRDTEGVELGFVGKLDDNTVAFLKCFDVWLALHLRIGDTAEPTKAAWASVIDAWNKLGNHAKFAIR